MHGALWRYGMDCAIMTSAILHMGGYVKRGRKPKAIAIEGETSTTSVELVEDCNENVTKPEKDPKCVANGKASALARQAKALARRSGNDEYVIGQITEIVDKVGVLLNDKDKLSGSSAAQLGILLGVLIDKKRILQGKNTALVTIVNVHEAGDRTISSLDRLAQALKGTSPKRLETAETIDIEAKPLD